MSETVPVHITSRGEYDLLSVNRVQTQKLAQGVLYMLMLQIEGDEYRAGQVMAEITSAPMMSTSASESLASVDMMLKDDDAQAAFSMTGIMRQHELYLLPSHLVLIGDGGVLRQGYFLTNVEEVKMVMELHELVGAGNTIDRLSL